MLRSLFCGYITKILYVTYDRFHIVITDLWNFTICLANRCAACQRLKHWMKPPLIALLNKISACTRHSTDDAETGDSVQWGGSLRENRDDQKCVWLGMSCRHVVLFWFGSASNKFLKLLVQFLAVPFDFYCWHVWQYVWKQPSQADEEWKHVLEASVHLLISCCVHL